MFDAESRAPLWGYRPPAGRARITSAVSDGRLVVLLTSAGEIVAFTQEAP
jgi:hypothetical protein